jgi:hypothetical protein
MSTHAETIAEALEEQNGLCDACLGRITGITPHQAVNAVCRRLEDQGRLHRDPSPCPKCHETRITNTLGVLDGIPSRADSSSLSDRAVGTPGWLDNARRDLIGHINKLEGMTSKGEPFSRRVTRLREEGRLSGRLCCLIQTVNGFRNLACYEQYKLNDAERQIVHLAYAEIERWMEQ